MAEEVQDKAPSLAEQWSLHDQEQTNQTDETAEKKSEDAGSTDAPTVSTIEAPAVVTSEKSDNVPVVEDANPVVENASAVVEDASPVVEASPAVEDASPVVEDVSPVAEESIEPTEQQEETQEEIEEKPEIKIETAPADFRFPTTNQTRHCFTRYIEYHRCVAAKGEDASECDKFAKYYRSLCPSEWVERWNEQRENGTFPGPL